MDARTWNLRFQVFRSRASIMVPEMKTRAAGVVLIRSSTLVAVAPYSFFATASDFEHFLFESLESLHIPNKLLAQDLMHELMVFSTNLFGRDPQYSYVILIKIKMIRKGEEVKYTYPDDDPFFKNMKLGVVMATLHRVSGICIDEKSMNEVKGVVKRCRRDDMFEQIECPICLREMDLGEEYVQTPCKHAYHTGCLAPWLASTYKPLCPCGKHSKAPFPACPMCRQILPA